MPYSTTEDPVYQVISGREGIRTVLAETIFPEGTFEYWGDNSPSMGDYPSCFGAEVIDLLMAKWRERLADESLEAPYAPVTFTTEDAMILAEKASSDGDGAIERLRDNGERTRLSYAEAFEQYAPLVGTTHRG